MQPLNSLTLLHQIIVARRKKLNLSQEIVAAKLGISQNRYSELESMIGKIDIERLLQLLSLLGLELQLGIKAEPLPPSADGERW